MLSPCIHCAVTGNHQLYQTAKPWFRQCLTYRKSSFPTLLTLNHTNTVLVGCRVHPEHGGWEPKFTFAWRTIAANAWNACACLPWSSPIALVTFITLYVYHGLSAWLVWAIMSLALFRTRSCRVVLPLPFTHIIPAGQLQLQDCAFYSCCNGVTMLAHYWERSARKVAEDHFIHSIGPSVEKEQPKEAMLFINQILYMAVV